MHNDCIEKEGNKILYTEIKNTGGWWLMHSLMLKSFIYTEHAWQVVYRGEERNFMYIKEKHIEGCPKRLPGLYIFIHTYQSIGIIYQQLCIYIFKKE